MAKSKTPKPPKASRSAAPYLHPEQQAAMRPDIGTQANFRKKKAPASYRYDSSLSPALDWDGQNHAREAGEWLLDVIEKAAAFRLNMMSLFGDTKVWEQSATYVLDSHPAVVCFVKNAGLGFAIPYFHNGQPHDYVPDFIVRLKTTPVKHLILETKGFDPLAEVKFRT